MIEGSAIEAVTARHVLVSKTSTLAGGRPDAPAGTSKPITEATIQKLVDKLLNLYSFRRIPQANNSAAFCNHDRVIIEAFCRSDITHLE